jgi:Kef-type K+ transport system membrane component KefB
MHLGLRHGLDFNSNKGRVRMHDNIPLITTLAAAFSIALVLGFLAERIKVPALVGYLVAGIIIGPRNPRGRNLSR